MVALAIERVIDQAGDPDEFGMRSSSSGSSFSSPLHVGRVVERLEHHLDLALLARAEVHLGGREIRPVERVGLGGGQVYRRRLGYGLATVIIVRWRCGGDASAEMNSV